VDAVPIIIEYKNKDEKVVQRSLAVLSIPISVFLSIYIFDDTLSITVMLHL